MCFNGGGRSAPAPAPAQIAPTPAQPTRSGPANASIAPSQFTSNTAAAPKAPASTPSALGGDGRVASGAATSASDVMGGQQFFDSQSSGGSNSEFSGQSPFNKLANTASFYSRREGGAELPGNKVVVGNQVNAPDLGGGTPGVGSQGFGERALVGGDAVIASGADPQTFVTNSTQPAILAPSDVANDPNYVEPGPNVAYNADLPYNMPMMGGAQSTIRGFAPNDPRVALAPGGPISRNLSSARTGYGRRLA